MVEASGEVNGSNNIRSQQRQRSSVSSGDGTKKRSLGLLNFKLLECPICNEPLRIPIFQCDNGHLACSSCCPKLSNKCPSCALPIGDERCRAMENFLESVFVPCPNAELGCTKYVPYGKQSTHEKECNFSPRPCPEQDCNFTGSYKDLYDHYAIYAHKDSMSRGFECGTPFYVFLNVSEKIFIKREVNMRLLFAVQCFREPYGVYVTVSCIAPSSPDVGDFSYEISYNIDDGHTITYKSPNVLKILEVNSETPPENSMLIPHSLLRGELLGMRLCIKEV